jgi:hypothetical protein
MRVPTVRVVNPADPGRFMTINAADHRDEHHELWPEQAEGFDPGDLRRSAAAGALDPALRDAAATLCLRIVAFRRRVEGESFAELTAGEQLAVLHEMSAEADRAEAAYEEDQRERATYEAAQREREAAEQSQQTGDDAPSAADLRVAKGPGGRWYVHRGEDRVSKGFATEAEAIAEMSQPDEARDA